jgi:hypothetical protein
MSFGPSPWSAERRARLEEMWFAGEKTEVIAAALNCHPNTINFAKRRFGLPSRAMMVTKPRQTYQRLSKADEAKAVALFRELHIDTADIARWLKVSEAAVYNSLHLRGDRP